MSGPETASRRRSLDDEVQYLKGVGPKNAAMLAKVDIRTVRDLLFYFPRRYEDRTNLPPILHLRAGQWATVRGRLLAVEGRQTKGGKVLLKAALSDGTGTVSLVWFNQPWIQRKLSGFKGDVIAFGQVKEAGWAFEIHTPEFELIDPDDEAEEFTRITPVYPLTDGLFQGVVRRAARSSLTLASLAGDDLPAKLRAEHRLRPLEWCLRQMHLPESEGDRIEARRRLVFEEFLALQLNLAMRRESVHREPGIGFALPEGLWDEVRAMLPFELTGAQNRVIDEIWRDMTSAHPMNRLLQGDVGSGKTAVAAAAMLLAVRAGYQAAIMAPTEILAEQHYSSFRRLFQPLGVSCALMAGKLNSRERSAARKRAESGEAQIVVGTHAIIQEGVEFRSLGLAVVDEQHRFGVLQRAALRIKGIGSPDVLVMTATPIPRTLTMTLYGDLDLSVIDELPPGRRGIKTHRKLSSEREKVYEGVRRLIEEGRQAYFVCPLVSESEKTLAQAATDLHYRLSTRTFPDLEVGLLHGQMKPKEKDGVMERFRAGEVHILVSTTVIEVGVDVSNASVMVIEDANRFGLSQLHQLRGRVGRGAQQSYCILLADLANEEAEERLRVMVETSDGFRIAEEDLRLRGPGDILGTRQSGALDLRVADLLKDGAVLERARQAAQRLIADDPELSRLEHEGLRRRVQRVRPDESAIVVS